MGGSVLIKVSANKIVQKEEHFEEEEKKKTGIAEELNEDADNSDRDWHQKKTKTLFEAQEMDEVEVALIADTIPNIPEGEELDNATEHVDVAMGHSSESEYSDNMETHEEEIDT